MKTKPYTQTKAAERIKKQIEGLEAKLEVLRAEYDLCVHPANEVKLQVKIAQLSKASIGLQAFLAKVEGGAK